MKRLNLNSLLIPGVVLLSVAVAAQESSGTMAKPGSQAAKRGAMAKSKGTEAGQDKSAEIKEALTAAPPGIAKTAKVMDWEGHILKEGSGAYTCYPTPPLQKKLGKEPMCLDQVWQGWGDAWMNHKDFKADRLGIAYMLEGDTGASNTDPYAEGPTKDNQWVVSGPHTMVLVADPKQLDELSTDPTNGGPFVMWKGTPYAHIMVPVGKNPAPGGTHASAMDMGSKPKSQ